MKNIVRQSFRGIYDRGGEVVENIQISKCDFTSCGFSLTRDARMRSVVRNVAISNCKVRGCVFGPAAIEDVTIDGLSTAGLHILWGAVFRHVVLKGKIGRIMVSPLIDGCFYNFVNEQECLVRCNSNFYDNTDWAIDIRNAEFIDVDLTGIPGSLVLRDPETQILVTSERARNVDFRLLGLEHTTCHVAIQRMFEHNKQDIVIVAAKLSQSFKDDLKNINILRNNGIAVAD